LRACAGTVTLPQRLRNALSTRDDGVSTRVAPRLMLDARRTGHETFANGDVTEIQE
jgi:hypothetical protein